MIKKESDGYHIYSEKGKHLGGPYSKSKAEKRLQQIEMFKHMKESIMELDEAKSKNCPQCGIKYSKMSKEEGFCVECATPINEAEGNWSQETEDKAKKHLFSKYSKGTKVNTCSKCGCNSKNQSECPDCGKKLKEAKDASQGSWTAKEGKNKDTFDVALNGKFQYSIIAKTSESAITQAKQKYKEIYKNPTIMDSNIAQCLTILEGGIPNSTGIRDALDKVITGEGELSDRERLTLLKYKLIGDNGKPTQLAKDEFSELFESSSLTAYKIYYDDGSTSSTNMAAGVSLDDAKEYFIGKTFTDEDHKGKETKRKAIKVEKLKEASQESFTITRKNPKTGFKETQQFTGSKSQIPSGWKLVE